MPALFRQAGCFMVTFYGDMGGDFNYVHRMHGPLQPGEQQFLERYIGDGAGPANPP